MHISKELIDKIVGFAGDKIESIILDQWRTREGQWSLVYGYSSCDNKCEPCGIYLAASLPDVVSDFPIRTVPIIANEEDIRQYGNQRRLHCKTIDQYVKMFVSCFTSGYALESIDEELGYVANFRLIYLRGCSDLGKKEEDIKKRIVAEVVANYKDESSKMLFLEKVSKTKRLKNTSNISY